MNKLYFLKDEWKVSIPFFTKGYKIFRIGCDLFEGCIGIVFIIIPNNLLSGDIQYIKLQYKNVHIKLAGDNSYQLAN